MKAKKLLVGLFVAFATILTACGGNNSSSKTPSSPSVPTPSVSTPAPSVSTPKPSTPTPSVSTPAPSVSTPTPSVKPSTSTSTPTPADPVATKISVTGTYKVSYTVGEELDLTGMQLKVTFDDNSHENIDVTADMLGEYDMSEAGIKTITVTYEGLTTTLNIEVVAAAVEKVNPTITFSHEGGSTFKLGEPGPTVTVTEGLEYSVYYNKGEEVYGTTYPTEPGTYAMVVEVTGNDQYNDLKQWLVFKIVENKLTPEITFSIESGATIVLGVDPWPTATVADGLSFTSYFEQDEKRLDTEFPTAPGTYSFIVEVEETETHNKAREWRWFRVIENKPTAEVTFSIETGATLTIGKDAAPTVSVTEGLDYAVRYDKDEKFYSNEFPTEPGTYAMVVEVTGNEQYNGTTKWVVFKLVEDTPTEKVDPEIIFSIENGATVTLGVDAWPTATVSEGADYVTYFEQDEKRLDTEFPTAPGTYSFIVEVTGNDQYNSARAYRWFRVVENKANPEVTFSIEAGATLKLGVDAAPTVTVTGGLDYTVHYEKDEKFYSNEFPTEPGTYAMIVTVTGNDQYNGTTKWVVFKLEEVFAVYFTNPNNWSKVNAYVWDASGNLVLGAWPGTPVQKDPTTGYYIVTGVEPGQNIIFNNGTSQTGDLAIPTNGDCKTDGKGWATLEGEIEDLTIRVYFTNPNNWSSVYAYSWGGTDLGAWPGTKLQKDATTGYYYIDGMMPGANIIFSNGNGSQTENLVVPTNGNIVFNGSSWVSLNN